MDALGLVWYIIVSVPDIFLLPYIVLPEIGAYVYMEIYNILRNVLQESDKWIFFS